MAIQINRAPADLPKESSAPEIAPPRRRRRREPEPRGPLLRAGWYPRVKHAVDFALALLLVLPAAPVVFLAALLVRLTSKGPAFYTQTRLGQDGKLFTIYKLRTMLDDCERLTGARWSLPGDPRVTAVGFVLRVSHLDELPQLLNVLKGEMSLIGPRPERPEFLPQLERAMPAYRQRLAVRPGVTGLAQVLLPADTDVESVRRKLTHDLYYIRHLGPFLDVRLLCCTALYALAIPFRLTSRLLGLPKSGDIEKSMRDVMTETTPSKPRLAA